MNKIYMEDLVEKGLVVKKQHGDLSIYKYHNKVFYNNLWGEDERLLLARGLVLDKENNIVQMPFTKVFNHKENGTFIDPEEKYQCVTKVNGFLVCATWYNNGVLISTTGSLVSDFVEYAKEYLTEDIKSLVRTGSGYTFMFECCHPKDPHIIKEDYGLYLIGARCKRVDSILVSEYTLDYLATGLKIRRPDWTCRLGRDILQESLTDSSEGFMIRKLSLMSEVVAKLKSKEYLTKKFFARGQKKLEKIVTTTDYKHLVDEEYYDLVAYLRGMREEYLSLSEQARINIVDDFIRGSI